MNIQDVINQGSDIKVIKKSGNAPLNIKDFDQSKIKLIKKGQNVLPKTTQTATTDQPKTSFWGNLGNKISQSDIIQKSSEELGNIADQYGAGKLTLPEAALQTAGTAAGSLWEGLFKGISKVTPQSVKNIANQGLQAVENIPIVKSGIQKASQLAQEHPRVAGDIGAGLNLAATLPGVEVAKPVEEAVGEIAGKGAGVLEKGLAKQTENDAIDIVKRDVSSMSKSEREAMLKSGQVEKPGIFKQAEAKISPQDKEMAKSVQDVVKKSNNPIVNIDNIKTKIANTAKETETLPKENDAIFNNKQLKSALLKTKEDSSVIFAGDKTLENAYDSVANEFMKIVGKKPNKLSSILEARKEFDQIIEKKFPNIFDKFSGDNVRANAVKDVRMAANDFIADKLPEGNKFKDLLKQQTNMYRAIDRIAQKAVPNLFESKFNHLTSLIRKHPWLSVEAIGAASGFGVASAMGAGGAIAGVLTNPIALGAIALYGSYRVGKAVITSTMLRQGLADFLRVSEKLLNPEEKQTITNIMDSLGQSAKDLPENQAGFQKIPSSNKATVPQTVLPKADPLLEEAKKYDNAEELLRKNGISEDKIQNSMQHIKNILNKNIDEDTLNKSIKYLSDENSNPNTRRAFESIIGKKLPQTQKGSAEFIRNLIGKQSAEDLIKWPVSSDEQVKKINSLIKEIPNAEFKIKQGKYTYSIKDVKSIEPDFYQTYNGKTIKEYKIIYNNGKYNNFKNPQFSLSDKTKDLIINKAHGK